MTLRVRAARRDDAARIAALLAEGMPEAWTAEQVETALELPAAWGLVLEEDEVLAGALLALEAAREAEILQVAVAAARRRHGHGLRLLDEALGLMRERGTRWVFLEVRRGNAAARALYRARDFHERGVRERYYHDGEDAVVMALELA